MSHSKVVISLEKRIDDFLKTLVPVVKYYSTINVNTDPKEALWVTSSFFADDNENYCFGGGDFIESGTCEVSIFARAGTGYVKARELADAIQDHFRVEASLDKVEVVAVGPTNEGTSGSARHWYSVEFDLEYKYFN